MARPTTKAALTRRIRHLERELEREKERADKNYDACQSWKTRYNDSNERVTGLEIDLEQKKIECAELHGYINRVEIEDDQRHLMNHMDTIAKTPTTGDGEPLSVHLPLRQRQRGEYSYIKRDGRFREVMHTKL